MPKMKTNRLAYKKLRTNAKGKVKRTQANVTHNTGKRSPKRMRRLRHGKMVDDSNMRAIEGMLPHYKSGN
jgi:large subunit ribosomal protein L35